MDCIFCKIISNEIPSEVIYEDELIKVFLDINPTTNGDTLIVPKNHLKDFREIDDNLLVHINEITRKLYKLYQEKLHCDGLTISTNTDYSQEIKHFHVHFIPRYTNDSVVHSHNKELLIDLDNIEKILNN